MFADPTGLLGAAVGEVLHRVIEAAEKALLWREYCAQLKQLLQSIGPLVEQITSQEVQDAAHASPAARLWLRNLKDRLDEAASVVEKCGDPKHRWDPIARYCLSTLPPEVQASTYFLDSLISSYLRDKDYNFLQVIKWFRGVNLDRAKLVLLAYHEENHWSLVGYHIESNTLYFANSSGGFHGHVRMACTRLMACFEHLLLDDLIPTVKKTRLKVPNQIDLYSCGWRVALNALLFTKSIFDIEDGRPIEAYVPSHLREFQIKATQALIAAIYERALDEVTNAAE